MIREPRRLSDKLLAAFDQACDQGRPDVAELFLKAIELVLTKECRGVVDRRQQAGPIVEAYGRLKALKEKMTA